MSEDTQLIYRPVWTVGRYDEEHRVAIFYNLLEGMSYFFEEESADVIKAVLEIDRNDSRSIEWLVTKCNIELATLQPFLEELCKVNLVTFSPITEKGLACYRKQLSELKKKNRFVNRATNEKLPYAVTSAEMAYTERTGGITNVMFELTYNCSEKCIHCYNIGATRNDKEESHRSLDNEMTTVDYKMVIDELWKKGLVKVTLSGGDPFSKPCIWEVIEYLSEKGIAFDVYTNGQRLLNYEERLASYYPRLVGISLYSGVPEVHDRITRIRGSFEKSLSVLEKLSELAVPLNIKCCVMQPNLKTYRSINQIAQQLGAFPQFEMNVTDSVEGDRCVSKYLRLTAQQYEAVLRDNNSPLYVGPEAPNFGGQPKELTQNGCGAGHNSFCIMPNGDVIPCCSFHMKLGNIIEQDVAEVLASPLLAEWRTSTLDDYSECGKQDYCAYCNLCPGLAYSEHSDWKRAAENCCYLAKIRYELASKMRQGYDPLSGQSLDEVLEAHPDYTFKTLYRT